MANWDHRQKVILYCTSIGGMLKKVPAQKTEDSVKSNIQLRGLVSLLNDISSEIIQPILPLFIIYLGGGGVAIGLIGGLSDVFQASFRYSPATGQTGWEDVNHW